MDNFGMNQSSNYANATGQLKQSIYAQSASGLQSPDPSPPLMVQEQDRLYSAIAELEGQLDWLLQKIQPVCQPPVPVPTSDGSKTGQIEATPSLARQALISLRHRIDAMSRRVSEVKYTIEV